MDRYFNENTQRNISLNNKGFTLLETTICFLLLSILLVAAAQIITSSTEVYYLSKSTSYGLQASQVIATELRGDIEDAVMMPLLNKKNSKSNIELPNDISNYSFYITDDGSTIYFISGTGEQICYSFEKSEANSDEYILNRSTVKVYNDLFNELTPETDGTIKQFTSKYVGMNYRVKGIKLSFYEKTKPGASVSPIPLQTGDFPVLKLEVTVNSPQYGDYTCTEYIGLYNFYGLSSEQIDALIKY